MTAVAPRVPGPAIAYCWCGLPVGDGDRVSGKVDCAVHRLARTRRR